VLWVVGEHYVRRQSLRYHSERLPPKVTWYCDPSGAQQRCDLVRLGHRVFPGRNGLESGVALVTARLADGTLKVVKEACPNLLYEASLYRWEDDDDGPEAPVSEHNHALDALRYLVSRLDQHRPAPGEAADAPAAGAEAPPPARPPQRAFRTPREML